MLNYLLSQANSIPAHQLLLETGKYILTALDASQCILFTFNEASDELCPYAAIDKKGEQPAQDIKINPTDGMTGWVLTNLKTLILDADSADNRYQQEVVNLCSQFKTRVTIITLPILLFGRLVGVMGIISQSNRKYAPADVDEFNPFLNLMAVAITKDSNAVAKLAEVCIRFLEERDRYTHGHSLRVAKYCKIIADEMGLTESQKREIHLAAILHDIGKVTLKDNLLSDEHQLTKLELQIVRMHPVIGYNILYGINKLIARVIRSHHEQYDGSGYPDGLKGTDIPLISRILAMADAIDAMVSDRPYQRGRSITDVIQELKNQSGSQFDPKLVDIFLEAYRKGKINI